MDCSRLDHRKRVSDLLPTTVVGGNITTNRIDFQRKVGAAAFSPITSAGAMRVACRGTVAMGP
jgi:hypothetical protein